MSNVNWRKKVDLGIKDHLEMQIREAAKNSSAYKHAKNQADAQLWCAVANLSKQMFDLNLKFNYLERALKDSLGTDAKKEKTEKAKQLRKNMRKL